jgi:hypothetical protein
LIFFQIYLLSVVICLSLMILLNKLHDGTVTVHDMALNLIFSVIPFSNIGAVVLMSYMTSKKFGVTSRLSDWWDEVGQKKVF